jgi:hypothetical protein
MAGEGGFPARYPVTTQPSARLTTALVPRDSRQGIVLANITGWARSLPSCTHSAERLRVFDASVARQRERETPEPRRGSSAGHICTREELYDRGRSGDSNLPHAGRAQAANRREGCSSSVLPERSRAHRELRGLARRLSQPSFGWRREIARTPRHRLLPGPARSCCYAPL